MPLRSPPVLRHATTDVAAGGPEVVTLHPWGADTTEVDASGFIPGAACSVLTQPPTWRSVRWHPRARGADGRGAESVPGPRLRARGQRRATTRRSRSAGAPAVPGRPTTLVIPPDRLW